ncbi:MAG: DUF5009 domain-containing protein [Bacteroidetes bacterium]|nr:DUF5009 domain-containing protein [Bacteroidota bacterium]
MQTNLPKSTNISRKLPVRLLSIDVLRAVTMFFMIFVNDVDGVQHIPQWIKHVSANADGLGFADTIFPVFLFIVGLSLPFAIKKRLNKGDSFQSIAFHILARSLALLVMGFLHVNLENYNNTALLPKAVWEILITVGFFLIWLDYPGELKKTTQYLLQAAGIILLLVMAFLFKGGREGEIVGLKPYWWGILGIIGWAYLVCALLFLFSKGRLNAQIVFFAVLFVLNLLYCTGLLKYHLPVIGNAASPALTMAGVVISLLYSKLAEMGKDKLLWGLFITIGIAMLIIGFVVRPYADGISKIRATTAWISICIGIGTLLFVLLIYLVDLKGNQHWFKAIRPAGTSTLTCYLIPYLLYSVYVLAGFRYPQFLNEGLGGIIRSFAVSFIVIWIGGVLEKKKLRLKI